MIHEKQLDKTTALLDQMASLLYFSSNSEKLKGTSIKHNHCIQIKKKCRVDIVTMRSIVRGERCNIFACVRCVSLLALLAANEPLVSAVTERKVSEVKTANMLKRKHMLLYAFPANMHFIIFFPRVHVWKSISLQE